MIAKVSVGKSFGGTIRYLFEGHKNEQTNKKAELLDYNGIRPDQEKMIKDFNRHRWLNPELGNAVGHISMSYDAADSHRATNQAMTDYARQLMTRLSINPDNTQWALIRHHDRTHQHCHLVFNRVDYEGKTIKDNLIGLRAKEAATEIAREQGLKVAADQKKDLSKTTLERLPSHDQARYKIYEALTKEVSQATNIADLKKNLQAYGIETMIQKKGQGMSFKTNGVCFKASQVDRQYTGGKIHAQIEKNRELKAEREAALRLGQQQHRAARLNQLRHNHHGLTTHRQSRTTSNGQQAEKAIERTAIQQSQEHKTDLNKAFGQLNDLMKQRDQAKAFGKLSDLMKERDQTKAQQEQKQELKQEKTKQKIQDRSKGLGI